LALKLFLSFHDNLKMPMQTNLNAGTGEPCAGQTRVTEDPSTLLMLFEFTSSENFGFVPPMGSIERQVI
jgi:hypothetical protein